MEYSKHNKRQKTKHLLNLTSDNCYLPFDYNNNLDRKPSSKSIINTLWLKYKYKVSRVIWLVNWTDSTQTSGKVEFRYLDIIDEFTFNNKEEVDRFININLLKYIGISIDLYYLFFSLYTRKLQTKEGVKYIWY